MKKVLAMILAVVMVLGSQAFVFAGTNDSVARDLSVENGYAKQLKDLGLFKGVSDTDFDLNRAPSRVEAMVMLIRLLGAEETALSGTYTHPFTDVPSWADSYIGYAYENGLTKGISATKFGTGTANAQMYLTYVLRALGYSDVEGQDFTYENPYTLAENCNILPGSVDTKAFLRADAVTISHASMDTTLKDSKLTLAEELISKGVFTKETYSDTYYGTIRNTFISEKIDDRAAGTYKITVFGPIDDNALYVASYGYPGGYNYSECLGAELKANNNIMVLETTSGGYTPPNPMILMRMFPAGVKFEDMIDRADWEYAKPVGETGCFDGSLNYYLHELTKDYYGLKPYSEKREKGGDKIHITYEGDRLFRVHIADRYLNPNELLLASIGFTFKMFGNENEECGFGGGGVRVSPYFVFDEGDLMIDFTKDIGPSEEEKDEFVNYMLNGNGRYEYTIQYLNEAKVIYTGTYKLDK
ncbi:MAG: hypothetical protein K5744_02345 [Eubacterium sp.]|nr:hypothetical protein [Eubacterium sp.]